MKNYRIKDGERMIVDGKEVNGGELIQLPDDLADMHKNRIEPVIVEDVDVEQA